MQVKTLLSSLSHHLSPFSYQHRPYKYHPFGLTTTSLPPFPACFLLSESHLFDFRRLDRRSTARTAFTAEVRRRRIRMEAVVSSDGDPAAGFEREEKEMDRFLKDGNSVADAAGEVIRRYFVRASMFLTRRIKVPLSFMPLDLLPCPLMLADREADEPIVSIVSTNVPSHAM